MGESLKQFGAIGDFLRNPVAETTQAQEDGVLHVGMNCKACGKALQIDEMHYLSHGDGHATCCDCETQWSKDVTAWRHGAPGEYPSRPGRNDVTPVEPPSHGADIKTADLLDGTEQITH